MLIQLNTWDLVLGSFLVLVLAATTLRMQLHLARPLLINSVRTIVQLLLVGLVLKFIFEQASFVWLLLICLVMLSLAGFEIIARQKIRLRGNWGYIIASISLVFTSLLLCVFSLTVILQPEPWYSAQYAIPLLGMLLGNTMNGIAIGMDRLLHNAWQHSKLIEARLILGQNKHEAIQDTIRESMHSALMPIINAMATAGIISLPGMMTGQILAGAPPVEAVKYQILIMLLIAVSGGFGSLIAVKLISMRLFDHRHRLRLDRIIP